MSEKKVVEMGEKMNNETSIRSSSQDYNQGTRIKQLIHEEYNTAYNHPKILEAIDEGRARDLNDEKKVDGVPVFIIGSGPSLDRSAPLLKHWNGGIICTTSHALTLIYYGVEPTHIMALDPFCTWDELKGVDWSETRTKLIAHPGVWPSLIENWPNDILLYRENMGQDNSFYATTQKHMFTRRTGTRDLAEFELLIKTEITLFACSPPAQLFAADRLGYGSAFLAGVDFAYPEGKERFTSYTVDEDAQREPIAVGNAAPVSMTEWVKHEHPLVIPSEEERQKLSPGQQYVTTENGIPSQGIHLYYKKNMISAWRLSKKNVYTTDKGAITEMPYMSPEKVISTQGEKAKPWRPERIVKAAERYLATVGAWVIESEDGGLNFIESEDPERDLSQYIIKMSRQYVCPNCGITAVADDGNDHTGDECQRCHIKPGLQQKHRIDLAKNMGRIQDLVKYARERAK